MKLTNAQKKRIVEDRQQGLSYREIAYDIGCSVNTAYYYCNSEYQKDKKQYSKERTNLNRRLKKLETNT